MMTCHAYAFTVYRRYHGGIDEAAQLQSTVKPVRVEQEKPGQRQKQRDFKPQILNVNKRGKFGHRKG